MCIHCFVKMRTSLQTIMLLRKRATYDPAVNYIKYARGKLGVQQRRLAKWKGNIGTNEVFKMIYTGRNLPGHIVFISQHFISLSAICTKDKSLKSLIFNGLYFSHEGMLL
jgi:hypothetical protein